jgi:hypothetical protein
VPPFGKDGDIWRVMGCRRAPAPQTFSNYFVSVGRIGGTALSPALVGGSGLAASGAAVVSLFICGTWLVMVLVGPEPGVILVASSASAGSAKAVASTTASDRVRIMIQTPKKSNAEKVSAHTNETNKL